MFPYALLSQKTPPNTKLRAIPLFQLGNVWLFQVHGTWSFCLYLNPDFKMKQREALSLLQSYRSGVKRPSWPRLRLSSHAWWCAADAPQPLLSASALPVAAATGLRRNGWTTSADAFAGCKLRPFRSCFPLCSAAVLQELLPPGKGQGCSWVCLWHLSSQICQHGQVDPLTRDKHSSVFVRSFRK